MISHTFAKFKPKIKFITQPSRHTAPPEIMEKKLTQMVVSIENNQ